MKKALFTMAIAIGLFAASCNNEKPAEGTHTHEDGTVHSSTHDTPATTDSLHTDSAHVHDESVPHTH